jgi:hypothetical protein
MKEKLKLMGVFLNRDMTFKFKMWQWLAFAGACLLAGLWIG